MAIIKGGPGSLDEVPEVKAAKDLVMGFQVIRADPRGRVPGVNQQATQFGTFPFFTEDPTLQGVWSTFGLDGAPGRSDFYFTTNGVTKELNIIRLESTQDLHPDLCTAVRSLDEFTYEIATLQRCCRIGVSCMERVSFSAL